MGLFGKRKPKSDKWGFYKLKVIRKSTLTPDSVELIMEVPKALKEEFSFIPGQYVNLESQVEGKRQVRSYSICHSEAGERICVGIKRLEGGIFSNFVLNELIEGIEIGVSKPQGGFNLDNDGDVPRLFVASGSGITPVLSMLDTLERRGQLGSATLLYGNKTEASTMFADRIAGLQSKGLKVVRFFTEQEASAPDQVSGRIDAKACLEQGNAESMKHVYFCGPQAMVDEAIAKLKEHGLQDTQIHRELFIATTDVKGDAGHEVGFIGKTKVQVHIGGDDFEFEMDAADETILDAAERAGYDLPYSCRGAVCCSCRAKVKQGHAHMDLNYALTDSEVEEGYVLCCQARPSGEHIELSFDE